MLGHRDGGSSRMRDSMTNQNKPLNYNRIVTVAALVVLVGVLGMVWARAEEPVTAKEAQTAQPSVLLASEVELLVPVASIKPAAPAIVTPVVPAPANSHTIWM